MTYIYANTSLFIEIDWSNKQSSIMPLERSAVYKLVIRNEGEKSNHSSVNRNLSYVLELLSVCLYLCALWVDAFSRYCYNISWHLFYNCFKFLYQVQIDLAHRNYFLDGTLFCCHPFTAQCFNAIVYI